MSRRHVDRNGKPKNTHVTWQGARLVASRMAQKYGVPFSAYACATCNYFHVGQDNPQKVATILRVRQTADVAPELGARVAAHLAGENAGPSRTRRDVILKRCISAERKRVAA